MANRSIVRGGARQAVFYKVRSRTDAARGVRLVSPSSQLSIRNNDNRVNSNSRLRAAAISAAETQTQPKHHAQSEAAQLDEKANEITKKAAGQLIARNYLAKKWRWQTIIP
jgi:hypothetical protein